MFFKILSPPLLSVTSSDCYIQIRMFS
uniref:Uncharacterized protein n=1 Tax=Anguilla anguilla TaxID=7936 RepID=A0A0E9VHW6_ANGAN